MQVVGLDSGLRPSARAGALEELLVPSELRALRDQPEGRRSQWLAGRLALKLAAGAYARKPWYRVETGHFGNGQPRIVDPDAPGCSLSHSGPLAVAAVDGVPVGVDVERIRPRDRALLEYIASAAEAAVVGPDLDLELGRDPELDLDLDLDLDPDLGLDRSREPDPDPDPDELVTRLWTIKEAALKWGGWGLSIPVRAARILRRPGPGRVVVHVRWQEVDQEITVWTMRLRGFSLSIASNEPNPLGSIRWDPPLHLPAG